MWRSKLSVDLPFLRVGRAEPQRCTNKPTPIRSPDMEAIETRAASFRQNPENRLCRSGTITLEEPKAKAKVGRDGTVQYPRLAMGNRQLQSANRQACRPKNAQRKQRREQRR